jgi:hypothetical protein
MVYNHSHTHNFEHSPSYQSIKKPWTLSNISGYKKTIILQKLDSPLSSGGMDIGENLLWWAEYGGIVSLSNVVGFTA